MTFLDLQAVVRGRVIDFIESNSEFKDLYTRTISLLSEDAKALKNICVEIPIHFNVINSVVYNMYELDRFISAGTALMLSQSEQLNVDIALLYYEIPKKEYDYSTFFVNNINLYVTSSNYVPSKKDTELMFLKLCKLKTNSVITKHLSVPLYSIVAGQDAEWETGYENLVSYTDGNDYTLRIEINNKMLDSGILYNYEDGLSRLLKYLDSVDGVDSKFNRIIFDLYNVFPSTIQAREEMEKYLLSDKYIFVFKNYNKFNMEANIANLFGLSNTSNWSNIYMSYNNYYFICEMKSKNTALTSMLDVYGYSLRTSSLF
jgi:hypothetical protein